MTIDNVRLLRKNYECYVRILLPHFESFFLPSWKETNHKTNSDSIQKVKMQDQPIFQSQSFSLRKSSCHFWFHLRHLRNSHSYKYALAALQNNSCFLHSTPHFSLIFHPPILLICSQFLSALLEQIYYSHLGNF